MRLVLVCVDEVVFEAENCAWVDLALTADEVAQSLFLTTLCFILLWANPQHALRRFFLAAKVDGGDRIRLRL